MLERELAEEQDGMEATVQYMNLLHADKTHADSKMKLIWEKMRILESKNLSDADILTLSKTQKKSKEVDASIKTAKDKFQEKREKMEKIVGRYEERVSQEQKLRRRGHELRVDVRRWEETLNSVTYEESVQPPSPKKV